MYKLHIELLLERRALQGLASLLKAPAPLVYFLQYICPAWAAGRALPEMFTFPTEIETQPPASRPP